MLRKELYIVGYAKREKENEAKCSKREEKGLQQEVFVYVVSDRHKSLEGGIPQIYHVQTVQE